DVARGVVVADDDRPALHGPRLDDRLAGPDPGGPRPHHLGVVADLLQLALAGVVGLLLLQPGGGRLPGAVASAPPARWVLAVRALRAVFELPRLRDAVGPRLGVLGEVLRPRDALLDAHLVARGVVLLDEGVGLLLGQGRAGLRRRRAWAEAR